MTASYRLIDYSLRPAKFAERKMLCEIFSRLKGFATLESYRYIGFGSIWYSDCVLLHRALGVQDIVSIEQECDHEERFKFNNPYRGIQLKMGTSAQILPNLDWTNRAIIWLDYDDTLSSSILDDARTVSTRSLSGTALAISVNAEKLMDHRDIHAEPLEISKPEEFRDLFGKERTPGDLTGADLRGWPIARTIRRMLLDEIQNGLKKANLGRITAQHLEFKQVAAFEYADGAKMTTIVGVFVDQGQNALFEACGFHDLSFYGNGLDALRIKIPLLTPKEMRHLDRSLPCSEGENIDLGPIPESDAKHYSKLYRYLPNFASFEP